jgi:hypothetical protein
MVTLLSGIKHITQPTIKYINENELTLEFIAYNYFWIIINYEKGRITPIIVLGKNIILKDLCVWKEETNLKQWVFDLDSDIKLRIPDKFLEVNEWN